MKRSQAVQEEGASRAWMPAVNIQEGSQFWFDARYIRTTMATGQVDWKPLGPFTVCCHVSPYAYELQLPASVWIHLVQLDPLLDPEADEPLEAQRTDPPPLCRS